MSLPSNAVFYDQDNVSVGSCFVNCGWFLTTQSLVRTISRDVVASEGYKDPRTVTVGIYSKYIPKKLIEDCTGHAFEDVCTVFESFLSKPR